MIGFLLGYKLCLYQYCKFCTHNIALHFVTITLLHCIICTTGTWYRSRKICATYLIYLILSYTCIHVSIWWCTINVLNIPVYINSFVIQHIYLFTCTASIIRICSNSGWISPVGLRTASLHTSTLRLKFIGRYETSTKAWGSSRTVWKLQQVFTEILRIKRRELFVTYKMIYKDFA